MKQFFVAVATFILVGCAAPANSLPTATRVPREGGGKIAFVSERDGNLEIYVMNPDGTEQTNLTNHPADDSQPRWSPDGERIAFLSDRTGDYAADPTHTDSRHEYLFVMDADGSNVIQLTDGEATPFGYDWSPDSTKIAYTLFPSGELWIMNADGGSPRKVGDVPGYFIDWSPDGAHVLYSSNEAICLMKPNGTHEKCLTELPFLAFSGKWSPDGSQIALHGFYTDAVPEPDDNPLYIMDADGSNMRVFEAVRGENINKFDWSPNGKSLVYDNRTGGIYDIWVMSLDDAENATLLAETHGAHNSDPHWQP